MQKRDRGWFVRRGLWAALPALGLVGCPNQELAPLEPCTVSGVTLNVPQEGVDKVDLLFVIDNSNSMAEEQQNLKAQLPRMVQVLTSGDKGDPNLPDDERFFTPVKSLQLGVTSTDLGAGGYDVTSMTAAGTTTCSTPEDGVLLNDVTIGTNGFQYEDPPQSGNVVMVAGDPNCASVSVPRYQTFMPPGDPGMVAFDFGCVATLGVNGCGFEQQLEAMLKAVSPSSRDDFFGFSGANGTVSRFGQGAPGGPNTGFVRDDAVLAVVIVSDEEDCSVTEQGAGMFDVRTTVSPQFANEGVNLRCGLHREDPNLVRPVARYIEGLKALKPDNPDRIIFAGIVGVDAIYENESFDVMLQNTQFNFTGDVSQQGALPNPACVTPQGRAYPGERFIKVAQGFGPNGVIKSICRDNFGPALDVIIDKIAAQLSGACLPRRLPINSEGLVECDVVEVLSVNGTQAQCDEARGRRFKELRRFQNPVSGEVTTRVVCDVDQVPVINGGVGQGRGWFYDNFSSDLADGCPEGLQQRIAFTANADLLNGSEALVECFQPVARIDPQAFGRAAVNSPCNASGDCRAQPDGSEALTCVSQTCQLACPNASDSECPNGWVCVDNGQARFCVSPTCPPSQVN